MSPHTFSGRLLLFHRHALQLGMLCRECQMCHQCPEGFFRGWFNQENAHLLLPLVEHISPFFLNNAVWLRGLRTFQTSVCKNISGSVTVITN